MRITRWRADRKPTRQEVESMLKDEGLEFAVEEFGPGSEVRDHRHPFDEIRFIVSGALRFNVAGNEFILREGDRLEVPSNTRHRFQAATDSDCTSLLAYRV